MTIANRRANSGRLSRLRRAIAVSGAPTAESVSFSFRVNFGQLYQLDKLNAEDAWFGPDLVSLRVLPNKGTIPSTRVVVSGQTRESISRFLRRVETSQRHQIMTRTRQLRRTRSR